MTILAVEFSSDQRSVAIAHGGAVLARAEETGGRTAHAFALIERVLTEAKLEREAIECLVVGLGPGSYAGIRAGIALAQGWQLATGVQLLGISTVEAMAAQAASRGESGRISIAIDAQRNEFYLATYELSPGCCELITPLHIASLDELTKTTARSRLLVWPELHARLPDAQVQSPDAAVLCQLAVDRRNFIAGAELAPIYLREVNFIKAPPARVIPSL
jgi:tRNA threonylcarbamoyladenosine biosynthesis protein TsaB